MGYVVITLLAAFLVLACTRGSLGALRQVRFNKAWILIAGVALQAVAVLLLNALSAPGAFSTLGLIVSQIALVFFCIVNRARKGMCVIALGLAVNALAVGLNQGMPTRTPDGYDPIRASVKHIPANGTERVAWLTDVIWIPAPVSSMISVGDIAISVGVCGVAYSITRRRPDELVRAPIR